MKYRQFRILQAVSFMTNIPTYSHKGHAASTAMCYVKPLEGPHQSMQLQQLNTDLILILNFTIVYLHFVF